MAEDGCWPARRANEDIDSDQLTWKPGCCCQHVVNAEDVLDMAKQRAVATFDFGASPSLLRLRNPARAGAPPTPHTLGPAHPLQPHDRYDTPSSAVRDWAISEGTSGSISTRHRWASSTACIADMSQIHGTRQHTFAAAAEKRVLQGLLRDDGNLKVERASDRPRDRAIAAYVDKLWPLMAPELVLRRWVKTFHTMQLAVSSLTWNPCEEQGKLLSYPQMRWRNPRWFYYDVGRSVLVDIFWGGVADVDPGNGRYCVAQEWQVRHLRRHAGRRRAGRGLDRKDICSPGLGRVERLQRVASVEGDRSVPAGRHRPQSGQRAGEVRQLPDEQHPQPRHHGAALGQGRPQLLRRREGRRRGQSPTTGRASKAPDRAMLDPEAADRAGWAATCASEVADQGARAAAGTQMVAETKLIEADNVALSSVITDQLIQALRRPELWLADSYVSEGVMGRAVQIGEEGAAATPKALGNDFGAFLKNVAASGCQIQNLNEVAERFGVRLAGNLVMPKAGSAASDIVERSDGASTSLHEKSDVVTRKIRKVGAKWRVYSEKGKKMGDYDSLDGAKKRLAEVEAFKHMD